jgi:hypothetical protein
VGIRRLRWTAFENGVRGAQSCRPEHRPANTRPWSCDGDKKRYLGKGVLKGRHQRQHHHRAGADRPDPTM